MCSTDFPALAAAAANILSVKPVYINNIIIYHNNTILDNNITCSIDYNLKLIW